MRFMQLLSMPLPAINSKHWAIHFLNSRLISTLLMMALLASLIIFKPVYAIETQQVPAVQKVISAFKQNNRVAISRLISYPLLRQAPLPPIRNESEFLARFDEVFDQRLLGTIKNSNLYSDWNSVGWRGVILNNGIVAVDPAGNITAINYHSPHEQALINKLQSTRVAKGRRSLHRSVNNYNQALVELTTARYHIRVDSVGQGKGQLRYTAWAINKSLADKPDIVLSNGRLFDSNGRNQRYIFDNGTFSYQLNIQSSAATAMPTGSLEVFKNGQSLMREVATRVIRR